MEDQSCVFTTSVKVEAMVYWLVMVKMFLLDHSCFVVHRIKRSDGFFTLRYVLKDNIASRLTAWAPWWRVVARPVYSTIRYRIVGTI